MSYIQPRASMSPVGRQPFRPGQWQGFKGVSNHTTYIQNNFFGNSYGTGMNYSNYGNYGNYGYQCCDNGGGMSNFAKWMLGIGAAGTLLGSILKLFGKGDDKEAAPVQTTQPPVTTTPTTPTTTTTATTPTTASTPVTEQTSGEHGADEEEVAEEETTNSTNWNINSMVCRDASGKTQNISGSFNITQAGANGEAPKEFTITDTSSGTAHTYKYELTGTSDDGKPIYTCKSMNGQAASTANAYTLETKEDGTPELVQYQNQANHGSGLKFGTQKPTTFSKTMEVNTSVGKGTITVTANSQKELEAKVKAEEEKSQQWESQKPATFSKTMEVNTSVGKGTITVTANSQEELDAKVKAEEEKSKQLEPKEQQASTIPNFNINTNFFTMK